MEKIDKITKVVVKVNEAILLVLIVLMTVDVFGQVILRYFTSLSINWMDEVARYSLVILTMFGMPMATHYASQLDVKYFVGLLPLKLRIVVVAIADLISIAFFSMLIYLGIQLVSQGMSQLTVTTRVPLGYIYICIPVCSLFTVYFMVIHLVKMIKSKGEEM